MSWRWHALAFVAANAVLQVANLLTGPPWWAVWPLVAWGAVLGGHFMVHRARHSDERWAKERTDEVRSKSYDRAHMDAITKDHRDE
jgi:hypothetical protein